LEEGGCFIIENGSFLGFLKVPGKRFGHHDEIVPSPMRPSEFPGLGGDERFLRVLSLHVQMDHVPHGTNFLSSDVKVE
jgi:hypothetical protein